MNDELHQDLIGKNIEECHERFRAFVIREIKEDGIVLTLEDSEYCFNRINVETLHGKISEILFWG